MLPFHAEGDKVGCIFGAINSEQKKRVSRPHLRPHCTVCVCEVLFFGTKDKRICYEVSKNARSVPGICLVAHTAKRPVGEGGNKNLIKNKFFGVYVSIK